MLSSSYKIKRFTLTFMSVFVLSGGVSQNYAAEMDHSHHNMGNNDAQAGEQDHSAHRAAIAAKYSDGRYARSESNYSLDSIDLLRMDDQLVKLADELGGDSPVILNFIFTSCTTVCPVLSSTFSDFQKKLGDDAKNIKMVSISIDPQYDTPRKLREYARLFKAGPQWKFYTGSDQQSITAQKAFNAYRGGKMNHIPLTFLKARAGKDWVRLEGFTSSSELLREFRNLSNS